ncbi:MAG TPA: hypothetical protein VGF71_11845 [Caulobacteraceae bacterium]|jgi:hypothetical protein
MNITFTSQQRNTLARGLLISAAATGLVSLAVATNAIPSDFMVRAEILIAFAQGALGA